MPTVTVNAVVSIDNTSIIKLASAILALIILFFLIRYLFQ